MHRRADFFRAIASLAGLLVVAAPAAPAQSPAPDAAASSGESPALQVQKKARQITVQAEDPRVKLAFSSYSDKLADAVLGLIKGQQAGTCPIRLMVTGSMNDVIDGPHTAHQVIQLPDGSFQIDLRVRLSAGFRWELYSKALIRVLLYDQMLRRFQEDPESAEGKTLPEVPWLVEGIEQLLTQRRAGRAGDVYSGILNSRKILSIHEILSTDLSTLDPVSQAVFTASSAALISALLGQPDGGQCFRDFIAGLAGADAGGIEQLLRRHFPGFRNSPGAMEKWWSLEVASLGQQQAFEYFSVEQTEALLDEALAVRFGEEPKKDSRGIRKYIPQLKPAEPFEGPLHDYEQFVERRDCAEVLQQNQMQIQALAARCFPLYRDVLRRYGNVVDSIIEGKSRGLEKELKSIDQARAAVRRTVARAEDYLNYYEATRAAGKSEAYEQYRLTRDQIEKQAPPDRKDRISLYLDAMEAEFGAKE
jgi:hypothetical protein